MFSLQPNTHITSQSWLLIDPHGLPRYWSTIWGMFRLNGLADTTVEKSLRYLESFYDYSDRNQYIGALDDAIGNIDLSALGTLLEGYFSSLQNKSEINGATQKKWDTAFRFVKDTIFLLSKNNQNIAELRKVEAKVGRLESLYSQLRISKRKTQEAIRSLPANVIEYVYMMLDPLSEINPFKRDVTRWRVFIMFTLLLHQGLRRGELLCLSLDSIRSDFDAKSNRMTHRLRVIENEYEPDIRYTKSSIKNNNSIRQIPVSQLTADLVYEYIEQFRGKPNHSFLINSQYNTPLSVESLTKYFQEISDHLPDTIKDDLQYQTGKRVISAHALRHTCAVVRLNQLLSQGDEMNEALQKMRSFFGWSKQSDMPQRYAKAVFDDRLATVWNDVFDNRVAFLRAIPRSLNHES
ncbi:MAG: site-specific integrase [Methylotenera sp.]